MKMKNIASLVLGLSIFACANATESDFKLNGFTDKKLVVLDDVTVASLASDIHGQVAVETFNTDMWLPGRKLTAGILLNAKSDMETAGGEIVATRRQLAKNADFWIVPINSVAIGTRHMADYESHMNNVANGAFTIARDMPHLDFFSPLVLDSRFSPDERRNRAMTTDDKSGLMICNAKSAMGACVHLVNIDSGVNPLPKWVVPNRQQIELIKNLGSQRHEPIDVVYAVIVKPTRHTVAMVNGMPAVEGEVIQGVLINARTMTPLMRFNQDYKTLGKNNPLIAF